MSTNPPEGQSYQPPTSNYSSPTPGYAAAPAAPENGSKPKGPNTLGLIAFVASLAAVIIGSIIVFIGGQTLGALVEYTGTSGTVDPNSIPAEAEGPAASGALLTFLGFAAYGVLGLWGFIQGIVAAVKNRGRGWGIAAIILSVVGGGIVAALWFAGFTAGAAPYLSA